jgi:glycosyltransferase involved in cell wall biosynthesis
MMTSNSNRIAFFFSTSGHSGVDRAVKHLIPSLVSRGYQVDLLHVDKHGPYVDPHQQGVRVIELGQKSTYLCLLPLIKYLRTEQPRVLLSDKDRVNRTALLAKYLSKSQCYQVLSSGTTISIDLQHRGWLERWIQKNSMGRLYPYADQVIVNSEGVADDMTDYTGLSRSLIKVVPRPVIPNEVFNTQFSRPDHPWFAEGEPPVILGVGELGERKDFETLIRAFAKLRAVRECRLVLLGKGKQKEQLQALAMELGVEQDVDLAGFKTNVFDYMAHAALFALTSLWEGLGFVLIEALALGTPVVSVDCPSGPREILDNGKYGPLVATKDVDALSKAMQDTLTNPLDKQTLKQAAMPYSTEVATDAYLDAFRLPLYWEAV